MEVRFIFKDHTNEKDQAELILVGYDLESLPDAFQPLLSC